MDYCAKDDFVNQYYKPALYYNIQVQEVEKGSERTGITGSWWYALVTMGIKLCRLAVDPRP